MTLPACPCCTFLPPDLFLPKERSSDALKLNDNTQSTTTVSDNSDTVLSLADTLSRLSPDTCLVDTHGHAHLEGASSAVYNLLPGESESPTILLSVSCAVQPADWASCLTFAGASNYRKAALGIHPWYIQNRSDDWLVQLEELVKQHEGILVGEIGLCKMARNVRQHPQGKVYALQEQRNVFVQQLELAARYQRSTSIHCVQQQGVLLEILKQLDSVPRAMALHSYTGTAHQIQELLKWEATLKGRSTEPLLYFGFSHAVNYVMQTSTKAIRQGRDAVRHVPIDRLLLESDVHDSDSVTGGTLGALAYVVWARDETMDELVLATTRNALRFFGI